MARKPVEASRSKVVPFAKLIDRLITESDLSQREIADALGYEKANMITMFKQGITRVPLDKVPALAEALGRDPAELVNFWLKCYEPVMKATLDGALGLSLSKTEHDWITKLREHFPDGVPPCDERFEEIFTVKAKDAL